MQEALKRGERVELKDIFSLEPRIQKARISRNPKTNERIGTPEKKTILFKSNFYLLKYTYMKSTYSKDMIFLSIRTKICERFITENNQRFFNYYYY